MALNDKQALFVDEFVKLGNAYQAALNAGYKPSTAVDAAKWINPETLKSTSETERKKYKPAIRAAIDARMEEKKSELIADQDEVLQYLTAVLRGQSKSSVLARTVIGSEEVIDKPPDEKERLKAAELLGKRYGLYTEKIDAEIDTELKITIDYGDDK